MPCQHGRVNQHAATLNAVQGFTAVDFQFINKAQLFIGLKLWPQHLVDGQRLVRVFTRILGCFCNVDLAEPDLARPFAAQVFISDATAAQMAFGQTAQAMRLVHLQHIALQHGVVRVALHVDAVVGKHVAVIFNVLAEFGFSRVLKPGLESGQHLVTRQLRRSTGVVVHQGNIGRFARGHAKTDADNFSTHLVERRGFCINGHQLCGEQSGQPGIERLPCHQGVVGDVAGHRGYCSRHGIKHICRHIKQARV